MWKSVYKIATVLIGVVIVIFPLGGANPKIGPKTITNLPAITPSTNEADFSGDSSPFYLPLIFEGSLAWRCYRDGGKECTNNIRSIKMVSPDEGWAVGAGGLIMHYTNGTWQQVNSPTINTLNSLAMVSANKGWAVGNNGTILHYQDGSWHSNNIIASWCHFTSVSMTSADEGWAACNFDGSGIYHLFFHYMDGVWQQFGASSYGGISSIWMFSSNDGWAVGTNSFPEGFILHYQDGVWKVSSEGYGPLHSITMVSSNEGWVVGDQGEIVHYLNGEWRGFDSPARDVLTSITMVSPKEGWAVGIYGAILPYTDGAWQLADSPAKVLFNSVVMVSASEGWIVGGANNILHYVNRSWQQVQGNPTDIALNSVKMVSATEGWAVGGLGTILHYENEVWNVSQNVADCFNSCSFSSLAMVSPNEGWIIEDAAQPAIRLTRWLCFRQMMVGQWVEQALSFIIRMVPGCLPTVRQVVICIPLQWFRRMRVGQLDMIMIVEVFTAISLSCCIILMVFGLWSMAQKNMVLVLLRWSRRKKDGL
jgi:photosystem II stability/assembly factor-like uncharacterized protein